MIEAFIEGVRSIQQACNLVILAPVALTVVAARGRWQAVVGAIVGMIVGGWLFAIGPFGNITDTQLRFTAALLIVAVVLLAVPSLFHRDQPNWLRPLGQRIQSPAATGLISGAAALMVTQWWRPCVGVELGSILTTAPNEPWGQLLPTVGFMLGISVPVVAIGLIYAAWSPDTERSSRLAWAGSALCVVLGLSVVAGKHGEIVSQLFQWSQ